AATPRLPTHPSDPGGRRKKARGEEAMIAGKRLAAGATAAAILLASTALSAMAQDQSRPGEGVTVNMARATWDTGWWHAEIFKQLLEELGYEVPRVTTLDNPPFYQAVSQGDVDLWVNGWFPLHHTYDETFQQGA